jgi:signal transduction histidine kinase
VQVHVEGEPVALPTALDLSAYRIVQEGLTNALKHAHATRADVTVHFAPDAVELEVRDDGVGGTAADGGGHGLLGIRERVKIYGGDMTAEPVPGRGFVLKTRLPL